MPGTAASGLDSFSATDGRRPDETILIGNSPVVAASRQRPPSVTRSFRRPISLASIVSYLPDVRGPFLLAPLPRRSRCAPGRPKTTGPRDNDIIDRHWPGVAEGSGRIGRLRSDGAAGGEERHSAVAIRKIFTRMTTEDTFNNETKSNRDKPNLWKTKTSKQQQQCRNGGRVRI